MARLGMICLLVVGFMVVQAMADKSEDSEHHVSIAAEPSSSESESMEEAQVEAEAPTNRRLGPPGKPSSDKSLVGGGVIIGGLVTAIFAAVFCYIRVTRKRGVVN